MRWALIAIKSLATALEMAARNAGREKLDLRQYWSVGLDIVPAIIGRTQVLVFTHGPWMPPGSGVPVHWKTRKLPALAGAQHLGGGGGGGGTVTNLFPMLSPIPLIITLVHRTLPH